jgi:hypothetical protein
MRSNAETAPAPGRQPPDPLVLAIAAAALDSAGNRHLPAGNLDVLMYHGDLLLATVPQLGESNGSILKCRHQAGGCIHMPGLVDRIATTLDLRKLAHRVNVSRRHLVREHLFDAVLWLYRFGGINRDVQAAGVVRQSKPVERGRRRNQGRIFDRVPQPPPIEIAWRHGHVEH